MLKPESHIVGRWIAARGESTPILGPVTGQPIATAMNGGWDVQGALDHARGVGGPALRAMGFHDRARMLKALAGYLMERKDALYAINPLTGATLRDGRVDIEGGIGTMMAYAAKGRRELPDGHVWIDGAVEPMEARNTIQRSSRSISRCTVTVITRSTRRPTAERATSAPTTRAVRRHSPIAAPNTAAMGCDGLAPSCS